MWIELKEETTVAAGKGRGHPPFLILKRATKEQPPMLLHGYPGDSDLTLIHLNYSCPQSWKTSQNYLVCTNDINIFNCVFWTLLRDIFCLNLLIFAGKEKQTKK